MTAGLYEHSSHRLRGGGFLLSQNVKGKFKHSLGQIYHDAPRIYTLKSPSSCPLQEQVVDKVSARAKHALAARALRYFFMAQAALLHQGREVPNIGHDILAAARLASCLLRS